MGEIVVADYDPCWPAQFAEYAARVRRALGPGVAIAVEHVGSTAVPGLAAKPVIDMDVVIPSDAELLAAIAGLATIGYVYEGDKGIPGRHAFLWPPGEPRQHLYVCARDSEELRRHLLFRDYLRAHPEEAARYGALKRELAVRFRQDRAAYNEAKTEYVHSVLERAGRQEGASERGRANEFAR